MYEAAVHTCSLAIGVLGGEELQEVKIKKNKTKLTPRKTSLQILNSKGITHKYQKPLIQRCGQLADGVLNVILF